MRSGLLPQQTRWIREKVDYEKSKVLHNKLNPRRDKRRHVLKEKKKEKKGKSEL